MTTCLKLLEFAASHRSRLVKHKDDVFVCGFDSGWSDEVDEVSVDHFDLSAVRRPFDVVQNHQLTGDSLRRFAVVRQTERNVRQRRPVLFVTPNAFVLFF